MPATKLRFLLLQIRNSDDAMRFHEVKCFARTLVCPPEQIEVFDLLGDSPRNIPWERADMVLLGGSGHYSAAGEGAWLERALDALRDLHSRAIPTFASCWGFQAMARAMGGRVIHDLANAEVGTIDLWLTEDGRRDPIFGPLGSPFRGQAGHEDHVVELPPGAVRLASSDRVRNQAYRFEGLPIYCTQFHPELDCHDILARVEAYPEYVEKIAGLPHHEFIQLCEPTPETGGLLRRFIATVFDN